MKIQMSAVALVLVMASSVGTSEDGRAMYADGNGNGGISAREFARRPRNR